MVTVFVVMMFLGTDDDRREIDTNLRFFDLIECNWYAKELSKRYGNYTSYYYMDRRDRVTTYCVPIHVNPDEVKVY